MQVPTWSSLPLARSFELLAAIAWIKRRLRGRRGLSCSSARPSHSDPPLPSLPSCISSDIVATPAASTFMVARSLFGAL